MKRVYSIGRDDSCDIRILDATNVVSRNHAILRIDGSRCYLTDQSTNGTYRNGIRLIPNVEYPVNKGDDISFGNVVSLDWTAIPELRHKGIPVWLWIIVFGAVLILAGVLYYFWPKNQRLQQDNHPFVVTDSLKTVTSPNDTIKKDSLVVLENVIAKKKSAKKSAKKKKKEETTATTPNLILITTFDDYKDADDEMNQDAL